MASSPLYIPLKGPNDIRLVCLQPGDTDSLVCDLIYVSLKDSPSYEALSYTWELDEPNLYDKTYSITLCQQTFSVAPNLYFALTHLQQQKPRMLWIDAISINQKDLLERAQQVRIMSNIYSSASRVVIWLGEEEPTDKLAFDHLRSWNVRLGVSEVSNNLQAAIMKLGLPELESPGWRALGSVLSRRWFRRMWIVQEAALAASATAMCGSQSIEWSIIENVLYYFNIGGMHGLHALNTPGEVSAIGGTTVTKIRFFKKSIESNSRLPLLYLLLYTRTLEAADPRDKVYGLLSLVENSPLVLADYSISTDELFENINTKFMEIDENLELLSYFDEASFKQPLAGAPWSPNWRVLEHQRNGLCQFQNRFSALSLGTNARNFSRDGSRLRTSGIIFDSLVHIGPLGVAGYLDKGGGSVQYSRDITSFIAACELIAKQSVIPDEPNKDMNGDLWRTMICNTDGLGELPTDDFSDRYRSFKGFMKMLHDPGLSIAAKLSFGEAGLQKICIESNEFVSLLDRWIHGRVFCRTHQGYLGMLPAGSQPGDAICGILGAKTPFVIREREKSDGYYQLIGECYIHGRMSGELFSLPDFDARLQDIVLG
ncbi:heterokaryon incompatibility protein-domain-containing protein [Rhexocercosporidium sp. MPI-PUGE-AT-0058]|nr:heterokaryon incompatibility protein-domain-containing protein [Rhexocercosporidium sp. MPI-PUGE-AT-0058]